LRAQFVNRKSEITNQKESSINLAGLSGRRQWWPMEKQPWPPHVF